MTTDWRAMIRAEALKMTHDDVMAKVKEDNDRHARLYASAFPKRHKGKGRDEFEAQASFLTDESGHFIRAVATGSLPRLIPAVEAWHARLTKMGAVDRDSAVALPGNLIGFAVGDHHSKGVAVITDTGKHYLTLILNRVWEKCYIST